MNQIIARDTRTAVAIMTDLYRHLVEAFRSEPDFQEERFDAGRPVRVQVGMDYEEHGSRYGHMFYEQVTLCRIKDKYFFLAAGKPVGYPTEHIIGDIIIGPIPESDQEMVSLVGGQAVLRGLLHKNRNFAASACVALWTGQLAVNVQGNRIGQLLFERAARQGILMLPRVPAFDDSTERPVLVYEETTAQELATLVFSILGEL
jgi:hypothetical protein